MSTSFKAAISQARTAEELAEALAGERTRLRAVNLRQPQGSRHCRLLTEIVDAVIRRMLAVTLPEDDGDREEILDQLAIVATGGYGRRELCPHSDIDVTFIVAGEQDPRLDETVRRMFRLLMETFQRRASMRVGYGYRALVDVADLDHQTQTALLDMRVIAGSHELANRFVTGMLRQLWPAAFARRKLTERASVIENYGGTPYLIEPDVREAAGGLRDLHVAEWLSAVSYPNSRGDIWRQLRRLGVVTGRDVQQVSAAREFLLTLRNWMHWETGRKADQLLRTRQEALAEILGYEDDDSASRVERLMGDYYVYAERIERVSGFVKERCVAERLNLTDELVASGRELSTTFPWARGSRPAFLISLGSHYQEYGLIPSLEMRRMVAEYVENCPDLPTDREAVAGLVDLLRLGASGGTLRYVRGAAIERPGVWDTLSLLAEMGVLQHVIPELAEAYRRVPFDQVHRHTIGFHSLEVVRILEELQKTPDETLRDLRRVWSDVQAPELLYLAALLHDIGKVGPPQDHSAVGAEVAERVCRRLRLDDQQCVTVATLVRHHLLMSETSQLRDLNLEQTVLQFVETIHSVELLNMLLLLTYADMQATGVLSTLKVRFLLELYFRAEAVLSGPTPTAASTPERTRRVQSRISRQLAAANLTPEQILQHTQGMPVSYLMNTRPEEIAAHIRLVDSLPKTGPVVEFEQEMGEDLTTLHVCSIDDGRPGLLSRIAGVLYAHEVVVYAAQVFTRNSDPRVALDTLWVDFHGRAVPPIKRFELEQDLIATLRGGDVEAVIARQGRREPPASPLIEVRVDQDVAEAHTLVEVEAEDQPGLLYRLTRAIASFGWDIHSARIATHGPRARDVFYVTTSAGGKLEGDEDELSGALREALCPSG